MPKRQLVLLFLCSLVPWTIGNGIIPLLPVFAAKLGASPAESGAFLAVAYVAITLGALSAGWISQRLHSRRKPLLVLSLVAVPLTWLCGQAADLLQLTLVTSALWFCGGIAFALTSILAGMLAGAAERGRVFGVLSMAGPVGSLLGGVLAGPLADAGGYAVMFAGFALLTLTWPLLVYLLKDAQPEKAAETKAADAPRAGLGWMFWLLFAAALLVMAASMAGVMGRSLVMDALKFSAASISSTGAVSGAVALPFGLLAGVLSDRVGRRGLLALGFLSTALGLGVMVFAAELWHFWLAISLITVQNAVSGAVGSALVTDLSPKPALSLGMALYSATAWLGGIAGFAATGLAAQALGFAPTFAIAAALALVSAAMLLPIKPKRLPQA